MKKQTNHTFGDDLPKTNPWSDDRLGVAPLAQRLAKIIFMMDAPYGYVIGVNGVWGNGKSTLLNFTLSYLEKFNEEADGETEQICAVDFRPWMVSGHQDLVVAFFKVLSEALGPRSPWYSRLGRFLAKRFGSSSDAIIDAAAKLAVVADVHVTAGAASTVAAVAKGPLKEKVAAFLAEPSIQAAHDELIKQLKASKKRFLITVDDIDRLSTDDVVNMMQMVKTVGQLPNVVYLLAYDREKITEAFGERENDGRPKYIEKIVQHEIELPKPSRNALLKILDHEISFMIHSAPPNSLRWMTITNDGIQRWVVKPRDVLRIANAVKFLWPAIENEVDPTDVIAMEGLRLFEPTVFNWIRDNKDVLFMTGAFQFISEARRKPYFERLIKTLDSHPHREQIITLIGALFPLIGELANGSKMRTGELYPSIAKRRGIASLAGYEAYFAMHPSSDAIPKQVVDEMVQGGQTDDSLSAFLDIYILKVDSNGSSQISTLIEELRHRFEVRPAPEVNDSLIRALFFKADEITTAPHNQVPLANSLSASLLFFVEHLVSLLPIEDVAPVLARIFNESPSVSFCADFFIETGMLLGSIPGREGGLADSNVVSKVAFDQIGVTLLDRIHRAEIDGTLSNAPKLWDILRAWQYLEPEGNFKNWTKECMDNSALFTARIAQGIVSMTFTTSGRSYVLRELPDEDIYDFDSILSACLTHQSDDTLNADNRELLKSIVDGAPKALERAKRTPNLPLAPPQ